MKRNNIVIIALIVIGIISFIAVEGFVNPRMKAKEEQYKMEQRNPLTHDFTAVLNYKNKYMGNISNISHLNDNLPLGNIPKTYKLYPEELTADINYKESVVSLGEQECKQAILYNSTANFVLIDNLEFIRFNFDNLSYLIARSDVEKWYGIKLSSLQNNELWKHKVQSKLTDENYVNQFFSQNVKLEKEIQ